MRNITSGPHLGVIHNWIKWRFHNGAQVTWGSHEYLNTNRSFTPAELEDLAQEIRDAVLKEVLTTKEIETITREAQKEENYKISITYDHYLSTAQVGKEKSPEYVGFEPALKWVYRKLKEKLGSMEKSSE